MIKTDELFDIVHDLPFLKTTEDKENFLTIVGALALRRISLAKAAEIMNIPRDSFLTLLDVAGVSFSLLDEKDVNIEKSW